MAEEFKTERTQPAFASGPERAPRPVAKPAPMAPRNVTPRASNPPPRAEVQPQQSALAEKLRAQREAAEKLAQQRVTAARERAEGRTSPEPRLTGGSSSTQGSARPKFSFADESPAPAFQPKYGGNGQQPLVPPRPALGGDRPAGFARNGNYQPQNYRQDAPPPYRPIDPATGYPGQSSRSAMPPLRPYGQGQAPGGLTAGRRPPPVAEDRYYPEEEEYRDPRLTRAMAARQRPAPEEGDDVFEEPAPPQARRRASAADYNAAYREAEEGYEEPRRRSSGPWLLLAALLVAAVATGGVVWYYQNKIKPVASTATSTEEVPVVPAPEQPAKTAAETPLDQPADAQPAHKKLIYDRIVGDQEVSGAANDQLVPTEQTPVQPEAQSDTTGQSGEIPLPASGQGTDDTQPLPLPPPPGDTGTNIQGSLDPGSQVQPATAQDQAAAAATQSGSAESIGQLIPGSDSNAGATGGTQASSSTQQPAQQNAGADSTGVPQMETIGQDTAAATQNDAAATQQAATTTKKATAKKAKAKTAATKTKSTDALGGEPVVLVPPSQDASTVASDATVPSQDTSAGTATDTGTGTAPPKKKKTLFDLFSGKSSSNDSPTQGDTQVASADTQQPATQQTTQTQTKPKQVASTGGTQTAGGSGYVAQLASFRSQAEAQSEYARLKGKYPGIVGGLPPNISTATVAGSTRYRLGLGPMASREDASKICGSLLASGERDCIVRKQ